MKNSPSPYFYDRSTFPALHYTQIALRRNLCRVYPTRYMPLNPPAQAVRVYANPFDIACIPKIDGQQAIVVFLPDVYEPQLAHMVETSPQVHVHPDIGLKSQTAYVSYSTSTPDRGLPMALWLELSELMSIHAENLENSVQTGVPVILVAGKTVAVSWFAPDEAQLISYQDALAAAQQPPPNHGVRDIAVSADPKLTS